MTSNAFDKLRASFSETSLPVVYVDLAHILVLAVLPIAALLFRRRRSPSAESEVGVVGLGEMGSQLCLSLAEKMGSAVAGLDPDEAKVAGMREAAKVGGARAIRLPPP